MAMVVTTRKQASYEEVQDFALGFVTASGWGVTYEENWEHPTDGVALSVYGTPYQTHKPIYHALNNTRHQTREDAQRAAYDAGVLNAYHYED